MNHSATAQPHRRTQETARVRFARRGAVLGIAAAQSGLGTSVARGRVILAAMVVAYGGDGCAEDIAHGTIYLRLVR